MIPRFPQTRPHCRSAFTLIELLTVIAIIGILAAIIIPTVGKVSEAARTAACQSNLRQFGVASLLYAQDHKGCLNYQTGYGGNGANYWYDRFAPYVTNSDKADVRNAQTIWLCPAVFGRPDGITDFAKRDYAMSRGTCIDQKENSKSDTPSWTLADFENPSRKLYIADVDSDQKTTLLTYDKLYPGGGGKGGKLHLRHGGKANILFIDGHVSRLGAPPLPKAASATEGAKWLYHDTPSPDF
ncbi:MAG: prepilin-type N-terminal cleavage/methylation domain-containing protein [Opitutaceae bacterium]|jgi:general secretion pathway protein G|nr:prepilin-type N-terminal cleavage/methylation domain-containing protein [Opitutaceae bacterium]